MAAFVFETPFGPMGLAARDNVITNLYLPGADMPPGDGPVDGVLAQAREQILEYMSGVRQRFSVPLAPQGTLFQRRVWQALTDIPYGETRSYSALAQAVGSPGAARAVGAANHNNPIAILIPCHRVVGKNGSLTGYAGGLELKAKLLKLEGVH